MMMSLLLGPIATVEQVVEHLAAAVGQLQW